MLYISAFVLGVLICLHVIGGSILFSRRFPEENPWWGFFLPTLGFVALLNFLEHIVALPNLVWLLPLTTAGFLWLLAQPSCPWRKIALPSTLFVGSFTFALVIRCLQPDVNFYNTEGLTDLTRILDFTFGQTLPPTDSWLPPYPHTGYYSLMHYGASVLKRLLYVDIGTAYNLSDAFLNALVLLACGAVGWTLSNGRAWVATLTLFIMAAGFTGATPILTLLHFGLPNPVVSIDLTNEPANPALNDFSWLYTHLHLPGDRFRVYVPGVYVYYSEFHATIAGHFLTLLTVFGVADLLSRRRSLFPWIWLLVAPFFTILSCPWFFFLVIILSGPTLILALLTARFPTRLASLLAGVGFTLALLWPTLSDFTHGAIGMIFRYFWDFPQDSVSILVQLWPVYLPWVALCFVWGRLNLAGRWLHVQVLPLFLFTEIVFFTDRQTSLEKTMSGFYGLALVSLTPLVLTQKGWAWRGLSGVLLLAAALSSYAWISSIQRNTQWQGSFMHLEGDYFLQTDPQKSRMKEVLNRLKGETVLIGKNTVAFFESPCLPAFTGNRCYLGWTNAVESTGHPDEGAARMKENNAFYAGTLPDPLAFLRANGIGAVLVWPNDKMSDAWLTEMKKQLAPGYRYHDCKGEGAENAGVFIRNTVGGD